jgi:hypothetical protein
MDADALRREKAHLKARLAEVEAATRCAVQVFSWPVRMELWLNLGDAA